MPEVVCNEPVVPLQTLRSPRVWLTMLEDDLPGKWVKTRVQLHHGLVDEDTKFENRVCALYKTVLQAFAKLHGETTRCFLLRAPESIDAIGLELPAGPVAGLACFETVFCAGKRTDGKVSIAHVDGAFAPVEFDLNEGLPKGRANQWSVFAKERYGAHWADAIKAALQFYLNSHTGPTGQVELEIPGANIVVGAILPPGVTTHNEATLAAGAWATLAALSGEWGKTSLADVALAVESALEWPRAGRRSSIAGILYAMPMEAHHVTLDPLRPKSHKLAAASAFVLAHTGTASASTTSPALRAAARQRALAALKTALKNSFANGPELGALLGDEFIYELLLQVPEVENVNGQTLRVREMALYLLSETRRAQRAAEVLRKGDSDGFGALLNAGHLGDATVFHRVSGGGTIEQTFALPNLVGEIEIKGLAYYGEPLWKQPGSNGAGSPDTDLLCDLAASVIGVYGARRIDDNRILVHCKRDNAVSVVERLGIEYYTPRGLPVALATQVHPCRGLTVVEAT